MPKLWRKDQASEEKIFQILKEINFKPIEEYKNQAKLFKGKCLSCGDVVNLRGGNLLVGKKPRCSCQSKYDTYESTKVDNFLFEKKLKPLEEYPGNTNKPWKMICLQCRNNVSPTLHNLKKGQGCIYCNHGTKKYDESIARLYLLHHKEEKVLKVGLANSEGNRLKVYNKEWKLIKYVELTSGKEAYKLEKEVLHFWRNNLRLEIAISANNKILNSIAGGYTETADESGKKDALKIIDRWIDEGLAKDLKGLM